MGSSPVAVTKNSNVAPVLMKLFVEVQATVDSRFTLKHVRVIKKAYRPCTLEVSISNSAQSFGYFG